MTNEEFEEIFGNVPFENIEKINKYIKENYISRDEIEKALEVCEKVYEEEMKPYQREYGLDVTYLSNNSSPKEISEAQKLVNSGEISYIYSFTGDKLNKTVTKFMKDNEDLKRQNLHKLVNLSDSDRDNNLDYINIMSNNLDLIKQELYQ